MTEAHFTTHPKFGTRVRVDDDADLTGKTIKVRKLDGALSTIKLTRLLFPAANGMPALYEFEDVAWKRSRLVDLTDEELLTVLQRAERKVRLTSYEVGATREAERRIARAAR